MGKKKKDLPILPHGQGVFDRTSSGKIRFRKTVTDPRGNKKRRSVIADTVQECYDQMAKIEKQIQPEDYKKVTLAQALTEWLEEEKKPHLSVQGYQRLKKTVKFLSSPDKCDLGHLRFASITPIELRDHISRLNTENFSHSEIRKQHSCLKTFYEYASYVYDFKNPMAIVSCPAPHSVKKGKKQISVFDDEEIQKFIDVAMKRNEDGSLMYRYGPVLAANIYMGLRAGELIALDWEDIDLKEKKITINKTVQDGDRNSIKPTTKTNQDRVNQLADNALKILKEYSEYTGRTKGPIMITTGGKRPYEKQLYINVKAIQKTAGIEGKTGGTHILRHTCASLLFRRKVELPVIAKYLGHSVNTLVTTYISIIDKQYTNVIEVLNGDLLKEDPETTEGNDEKGKENEAE